MAACLHIKTAILGSHTKKHIHAKEQINKVFIFSSLEMPGILPGFPQHLPLPPLTPSQLPWLAQLAASSCGEGVVVLGEHIRSLAQGIQQTFNRLMEGQLDNTNYVVIIVLAPGQETQSCVIVTGEKGCLQTKNE